MHTVLSVFETSYRGGRTGSVTLCTYRRLSSQTGVRVLVMDPQRLSLLLTMVEETRDAVISQGFDRMEH